MLNQAIKSFQGRVYINVVHVAYALPAERSYATIS